MVGSDEEGSAWKCDHNCTARADECYLHNFLEEMPDLNLRNGAVIKEIEVIYLLIYHILNSGFT